LQIEATDATILRLSLTPQGIAWELLQPPTITTARAVDRLSEASEEEALAETREKDKTLTFTGTIKGQVREGRPDKSGKKTAWARVAIHEEGNDQAKMLSMTFHRHTANLALALPADAQITAQGHLRPSRDPIRMDSFYVFNLVNYPGKPPRQQDQS